MADEIQGPAGASTPATVPTPTPAEPAKGLGTDLLFTLLPADAQPIIDLFMKPFSPDALWAALEAAGRLGKRAADYLESTPNRPRMHQVVGAKTIMNDELCHQLTERLQKSPPVTAGDGPPAVAFDPVLASLIVTLAGRVAVELMNRIGG